MTGNLRGIPYHELERTHGQALDFTRKALLDGCEESYRLATRFHDRVVKEIIRREITREPYGGTWIYPLGDCES